MTHLSCPSFFSRPRRASFSSKESTKGDGVCQQLSKKLQNLKKKIKQFEEQFEKDKNYMVGTATVISPLIIYYLCAYVGICNMFEVILDIHVWQVFLY